MTDLREEAEEAVLALADFKEQQAKSNHPMKFDDAIRAMRRKILGMYAQMLNARKPVDNPIVTPSIVVL